MDTRFELILGLCQYFFILLNLSIHASCIILLSIIFLFIAHVDDVQNKSSVTSALNAPITTLA